MRTLRLHATLRLMGLTMILASPTVRAADAENRLANGDFQTPGRSPNTPADWPGPNAAVSYPEVDGNRFLRVICAEPGKMHCAYRSLPLSAGDRAFELRFRVRYAGIVKGEKAWYDGRVIVNAKDAAGQTVATPAPPYFTGTHMDWRPIAVRFAVPEGAVKLDFQFALFNAAAGVIEFDDIALTAIDPAAIPPRAVRIGDRVVPPPPADRLAPALHVRGNKIVDADGREVWLQGVSIASLEWSVGGDNVLESVDVAVDDWRVNCIRLPVKGTYWFGREQGQRDGGAEYRRNVDSAIHKITGRGAYAVLDLHRFRAVTEDDLAFWREAAVKYKNHPAVLFEVFNEPYNISWDVWLRGGEVSEKRKAPAGVAQESAEMADVTFHSPGTQALVDAIRATGAMNPLIVGALDFSYDLSGILQGYAVRDHPEGQGIIYSSHVYPWKRDWHGKFLEVAEKHPVFIGECGAPDEPMPFQTRATMPDPHAWSIDFLAMAQARRLHWTGWCFHTSAGPKMLEDWRYTPTPYWGAYAKRALNGERFTGQKIW